MGAFQLGELNHEVTPECNGSHCHGGTHRLCPCRSGEWHQEVPGELPALQDREEKHRGPAGKGCWELLVCKFRGRWTGRESSEGGVSCRQRAGGKLRADPTMLNDALPWHLLPKGPLPKKARCLSDALVFSALLVIPLQGREAATLRRNAQARGDDL